MVEKLNSSAHKTSSDSLAQLLLEAQMIDPSQLGEASQSAKRLDMPLDKAIRMLKSTSEYNLMTAVQANEMVLKGKIDLPLAIKALRLAKQNDIKFEDALNVTDTIAHKTGQMPVFANPLIEILLGSQLVSIAQITQIMRQAQDANISIGSALIVNRVLSRWTVQEALTALSLVKEAKITRHQSEQAMRTGMQRHVGVLQVLFESGEYKECSGETLKLSELIAMAQLITESDYLNCLEISICQDKSFSQVMLEINLITVPILEAACLVLDMVGSHLRPFQAAEALRQVRIQDISLYQAIAELQPPPLLPQRELSLSDLIVEAGLQTKEAVIDSLSDHQETAIKAGKKLMAAHLISENSLYKALRCYSLLKEGVLSIDQTISLLHSCKDDNVTIEDTLVKFGWNIPARMHWSWV